MKVPPKAAADAVDRLSPLNYAGNPRLRLIHASDVLTLVEGFFRDTSPGGIILREVFETRLLPKYPLLEDCWILEWWEPPEFWGSPREWDSQMRQWEGGRGFLECGPYPSEGDYRLLTAFKHQVTGQPTQPTELLIERIVSRLGVPTRGDLQKEQNAKTEAEDSARLGRVEEVIGDIPFGGRMNNTSPRGRENKFEGDHVQLS